jgi:hypothetical protein
MQIKRQTCIAGRQKCRTCLSICIPEDKRPEVALDVLSDCVLALDCKGCIEELAGVVVDELAIADEESGIDPLQVLPAEVNRTATRKAVPFTSDLKKSGAWKQKKNACADPSLNLDSERKSKHPEVLDIFRIHVLISLALQPRLPCKAKLSILPSKEVP